MARRFKFDEVVRLLLEYKEENGHCNVPKSHKTASGVALGWIVSNIRRGKRSTTLEEKAQLDAIGFVWKAINRKK